MEQADKLLGVLRSIGAPHPIAADANRRQLLSAMSAILHYNALLRHESDEFAQSTQSCRSQRALLSRTAVTRMSLFGVDYSVDDHGVVSAILHHMVNHNAFFAQARLFHDATGGFIPIHVHRSDLV